MINGKQADLEKSEIGLHSTPTVVNDTIIVGSSMFEGLGYEYATNVQGQARAFDARTGKLLWAFHGIPRRGEFGFDTWKNESAGYTGNNGVWTQITVDPEAGIVYLPVETPTIDEYGGNRPGDNLFAESLVAVDLKTGVRKWHFQFVHHPLWDHDMSSAPLLIDTTIDGKPRKIVAVPSKQGWLYCFDRITGVPIWPIEERPVPQTTMKHEQTAPTQPFVTKPVPYARIFIRPERPDRLHAGAAHAGAGEPQVLPLGAVAVRAADGSRVEAARRDQHRQHRRRHQLARRRLRPRDRHLLLAGRHDQRHRRPLQRRRVLEGDAREQGQPHAALGSRAELRPAPSRAGAGRRPRTSGRRSTSPVAKAVASSREGLEGLPIVKPPYGVLSAIDLKNPDKLLFQVPHGDTPDNIRNHPLLKGMNIPKTGQSGSVGVLITKTFVAAGDPGITTVNGVRGASLRAYDKMTGAQIGEVRVPAPVVGHPMTYSIDGRQYIVVGVSGGNYTGEYIAFRLPASELPRTNTAGQ